MRLLFHSPPIIFVQHIHPLSECFDDQLKDTLFAWWQNDSAGLIGKRNVKARRAWVAAPGLDAYERGPGQTPQAQLHAPRPSNANYGPTLVDIRQFRTAGRIEDDGAALEQLVVEQDLIGRATQIDPGLFHSTIFINPKHGSKFGEIKPETVIGADAAEHRPFQSRMESEARRHRRHSGIRYDDSLFNLNGPQFVTHG